MFKVKQKVRRNPRVWKKDSTVFTVVAIKDGLFMCQRPGKTECVWTGKMVAHQPMPYQADELVAA